MPTRFAAVALAGLGVLVAGCGGQSGDNARGKCQGRLVDSANAAVVVRMFDSGKLGSRTLVERELGRSYSAGITAPRELQRLGSKFFDANGRLIPYVRLNHAKQSAFNDFMYRNGRVHSLTMDAQERATNAVQARFDDLCS